MLGRSWVRFLLGTQIFLCPMLMSCRSTHLLHIVLLMVFFSSLGAKDISAVIGMPPMQNHQHIDNLAAHYRHQRQMSNTSGQNNKKRKRTELQRDEQDMEVEEEGKNSLFCGNLKNTGFSFWRLTGLIVMLRYSLSITSE